MNSDYTPKSKINPGFSLDEGKDQAAGSFMEEGALLDKTRYVSMDVIETKSEVIVEIDLPGIAITDVKVTMEDDLLVIEGIKREPVNVPGEKINYLCMERSFGPFKRMLKIPLAVDQENVTGEYNRGVLLVTLPKQVERRIKAREVHIKEVKG